MVSKKSFVWTKDLLDVQNSWNELNVQLNLLKDSHEIEILLSRSELEYAKIDSKTEIENLSRIIKQKNSHISMLNENRDLIAQQFAEETKAKEKLYDDAKKAIAEKDVKNQNLKNEISAQINCNKKLKSKHENKTKDLEEKMDKQFELIMRDNETLKKSMNEIKMEFNQKIETLTESKDKEIGELNETIKTLKESKDKEVRELNERIETLRVSKDKEIRGINKKLANAQKVCINHLFSVTFRENYRLIREKVMKENISGLKFKQYILGAGYNPEWRQKIEDVLNPLGLTFSNLCQMLNRNIKSNDMSHDNMIMDLSSLKKAWEMSYFPDSAEETSFIQQMIRFMEREKNEKARKWCFNCFKFANEKCLKTNHDQLV